MKILKPALLGLALSSTMSMADDCTAPAMPAISEGEESTMEQMLETQQAVKAFQAANGMEADGEVDDELVKALLQLN